MIDLNIAEKEVVSIVGASGAGKTTLLQILGTLDVPDAGAIFYNGTDISRLKGKQLAAFRNNNIGFVFQFHQLLPEFTALENVCIPAYISGKTKIEAEGKAAELLGFLNLSDRLDHKPSELSGGEQQRVAVARALVNNPSVILADEPSGNLDSENKTELHKLFFRLRDTFNQTIVIVTHDRQLASMSNRILQIKDGLIVNEP
jgi:lipoprotein-releasing system ATP-binding protein